MPSDAHEKCPRQATPTTSDRSLQRDGQSHVPGPAMVQGHHPDNSIERSRQAVAANVQLQEHS